MPDILNYRVEPQPGGPSMCLTHQTTEKDPIQGSPLSAWTAKLWRKTGQRGILTASYKTLEKTGTKQSVTLHTLHCAIFTLNSHEGRAATGKRNLVSMCSGSLQSCPTLCDPVDCGLPGFSVRGLLQARILECIGQYWLPYSSSSTTTTKSLQSCPTLCHPTDSSTPGSTVPGILQARTLEWVAISFSSAWKWKVKVKSLSRIWLFTIPWTAADQAPLSMGFSRQEYWSGLEHYISCCPSCQLPWVPTAARTPATEAAAPLPHLALTGANPSPPGQPQKQSLVDHPNAEVEIKSYLKPRGSVAKEEDSKTSHQLYKLQIKPTRSTRQTLCL